jgi:glycogen operon protein
MLLMGDEVRWTQRGNNNAYCQDNEISWFDWGLLDRHADIHRFARLLLEGYQQRHVIVGDLNVKLSLNQALRRARIEWHGVELERPDWSEHSHSIAFTLRGPNTGFLFHAMLNAYWEPLTSALPSVTDRG